MRKCLRNTTKGEKRLMRFSNSNAIAAFEVCNNVLLWIHACNWRFLLISWSPMRSDKTGNGSVKFDCSSFITW